MSPATSVLARALGAGLLLSLLSLSLPNDARAQREDLRPRVPVRVPTPTPADTPYVNLSELHYRSLRPAEGILERRDLEDNEMTRAAARPSSPTGQDGVAVQRLPGAIQRRPRAVRPEVAERPRAVRPGALRAVGEERIVVSADALGGARGRLRPGALARPSGMRPMEGDAPACTPPRVTHPESNCCSFKLPDGVAGNDVWYKNPSVHWKNDEDAGRAFAATIRASMPFFLPYRDGTVRAGQGWFYNSGAFHGSVDYGKSSYPAGKDPAFAVHASADGRVVTAEWNDWLGNVVVIDHQAANGDRYRSVYMHLRDGITHDQSMASAISLSAKDKQKNEDGEYGRKYRYWLYAQNASSDDTIQWGTDAQKILVKPGDTVRAGQQIGWSGNTGYGGAGWGLNNDGEPYNATAANNHLHFQITALDPDTGVYVFVDPYGVYEEMSTDCYDLLDRPAYVRLLAPFYPSFHNVPLRYLTFYWSYYTGMGMTLQTADVHRRGDDLLASGAFQSGHPPTWYARFYMTGDEYQQWFETYADQGYRPRELSVTKDGSGQPRFTVIWTKTDGEGFVAYHNMTDADWTAKWNEHVENGKMRLEDRVAYEAGGTRRWAAVFVSDPNPAFAELHYMTPDEYQTKFAEFWDQGLRPWSVDPAELSGGLRFGAIWRPMPNRWIARHGLTPAGYQSTFEEMVENGYRLHRVRGYANSERFAAIWSKP